MNRSSGPNAEVSEGIQSLSRANAKLERMLAKIGTKADTPDFRDRLHSEQTSSTRLVRDLMVQLKRLSSDPAHSQSSVLGRLTAQFDREFRRFQTLNSSLDAKQVQVIDAVKAQRKSSMRASTYDEEDPLHSSEHASYADNAQQQEQSMDIQFIEYDVAELEKRTREISRIEQDVLEVSEMYKDLSHMVHEQQEHIDSIEGSVVAARDKTEAAHKELLEAEEYQKKSRKKKCCMLFLILGIVGVVVMIIFLSK